MRIQLTENDKATIQTQILLAEQGAKRTRQEVYLYGMRGSGERKKLVVKMSDKPLVQSGLLIAKVTPTDTLYNDMVEEALDEKA